MVCFYFLNRIPHRFILRKQLTLFEGIARPGVYGVSRGFNLRITVFLVSFLLVVLSLAAPIRQSVNGFPNGESLYKLFAFICHQLPSRSFWIFGFPCGLCSRCLLGYLGVAVAALLVSRPKKYTARALLGATLLLPAVLDVVMQNSTGYQSINLTRAVTGFLGGIGFFIICFPSKLQIKGGLKMKFLNYITIATICLLAFSTESVFARELVLRDSTIVPVQTAQRISSKEVKAGQQILLEVERDIKVDGITVIEARTAVVARVSDRKGAAMAGISGALTINVEYTNAVDGTEIPLKGFQYKR